MPLGHLATNLSIRSSVLKIAATVAINIYVWLALRLVVLLKRMDVSVIWRWMNLLWRNISLSRVYVTIERLWISNELPSTLWCRLS